MRCGTQIYDSSDWFFFNKNKVIKKGKQHNKVSFKVDTILYHLSIDSVNNYYKIYVPSNTIKNEGGGKKYSRSNRKFTISYQKSVDYSRKMGMKQSEDFIVSNLELITKKTSCFLSLSDEDFHFNIIGIDFKIINGKQFLILDKFSFNPFTGVFIKREKVEKPLWQFLEEDINFQREVFIHKFKDPNIKRKKIIDEIIKMREMEDYYYIVN
jgi:hypothetical protein